MPTICSKFQRAFRQTAHLWLTGSYGDPKTGDDIWILPDPLGGRGPRSRIRSCGPEFDEHEPQFSPDGHWIAYQSNESGRYEVYVAPFPGPGGKRQVSTAGGTRSRWRADGKELFYIAADNRLMAAEVDAKKGTFEVKVEPLFGPIARVSRPATTCPPTASGFWCLFRWGAKPTRR